jgi:hypothetical protein
MRAKILAVFLSASALAVAGGDKENKILFDFENGAKNWTGLYDEAKTSDDAHDGVKSFLLKTNDAYNREYLSPFFDVESGKKYKVTCWIKLDEFEAGNSPVNVNIRWYFGRQETFSFGGWNVFRTTPGDKGKSFGWKKIEKVIQVPVKKYMKKKIKHARIQIRNYRAKGTAKIDSIEIVPADAGAKAANVNNILGM